MKRTAILTMTLTACAALVSCAGGPQRGPPTQVINRVLATAPGAAQPSAIVSTEIAYSRAAQELGYVAAAERFAAPGALLHSEDGVVPFSAVAGALAGMDLSSEWGPRVVVKSCDGAIALSQGRFVDGEGKVGSYVTTWVRQTDGTYKWTYDSAGLDDPQPPPRRQFEDGDIVVTAIDAVQGLVATCPRGGESIPPPPAIPIGDGGASAAQLSSDGTLRWRWEHREGGEKYVIAEYFYLGEWETAFEESLSGYP